MTKLNKTAAAAVLTCRIPRAVVGHNKRLVRTKTGVVKGMLYSHAVVEQRKQVLILRSYGFRDHNTRRAMIDFLSLLDYPNAKVSFAKGQFRAVINGVEYLSEDGKIIKVKREQPILRQDQPGPVGEVRRATQ